MRSESLEDVLGFHFRKPELLRTALTHKSAVSGKKMEPSNERMEFLGDSIISAIVACHLYEHYPLEDEGSLSKRKASIVSRSSLAQWAMEMDLGKYLVLSPGEQSTGGRSRPSIAADAVEAVIGAVFLDGGFDAASRIVGGWLGTAAKKFEETDYKSRLQEVLLKRFRGLPEYQTISTSGPEHDKRFFVEVFIGKERLGKGVGKSRKEAEQVAAQAALTHIQSRI